MKQLLVMLALVLTMVGCSTTPKEVEQAQVPTTVYLEPVYVDVIHPALPDAVTMPVIEVKVHTAVTLMGTFMATVSEANVLSEQELHDLEQYVELMLLLQLEKDPLVMETMDQDNATKMAVYNELLATNLEEMRKLVDYYRNNKRLAIRGSLENENELVSPVEQ